MAQPKSYNFPEVLTRNVISYLAGKDVPVSTGLRMIEQNSLNCSETETKEGREACIVTFTDALWSLLERLTFDDDIMYLECEKDNIPCHELIFTCAKEAREKLLDIHMALDYTTITVTNPDNIEPILYKISSGEFSGNVFKDRKGGYLEYGIGGTDPEYTENNLHYERILLNKDPGNYISLQFKHDLTDEKKKYLLSSIAWAFALNCDTIINGELKSDDVSVPPIPLKIDLKRRQFTCIRK